MTPVAHAEVTVVVIVGIIESCGEKKERNVIFINKKR